MSGLGRRVDAVRADHGMSLIELLVAIVVFGILGSAVLGLWVSTSKSVTATTISDTNTQAAGNIMAELSRVIRAGTDNPVTGGTSDAAFVSGTGNSLSIYSYVDSNAVTTTPFLVQFTVNSTTGQIQEKRWPAIVGGSGLYTFNSAATPTLTRTLPGRIDASSTLFTYLDLNGAPMTLAGTGLSPAQRLTVASVTVNVVVQASANTTANPATLRNTVGLPNLDLDGH